MEREPQWAPDGRSVAYLSDESGENALHLRAQDGGGDIVKIPLKTGFYGSPRFSPDSRKIALVDSFQRLWYVDLEAKKQVEVAQDHYQMRNGTIVGAWSPDSKWLAYSKVLRNHFSAIHLFSVLEARSRQITGMSDALNPVFDMDGKYLFFTASTNSGESLGLDLRGPANSPTSSIYLVVLDKTIPSPFAPESDEEKAADDALAPSDGSQAAKPPESAKSKAGSGCEDRFRRHRSAGTT
jgi:tricorn protease